MRGALFAVVALVWCSGAAEDIICFGDSWAAFACDTLADVLRVREGLEWGVPWRPVAGTREAPCSPAQGPFEEQLDQECWREWEHGKCSRGTAKLKQETAEISISHRISNAMRQANFWANNLNSMTVILAETQPKFIWLSIGGDDILGSFLAQHGNFTAINMQVW